MKDTLEVEPLSEEARAALLACPDAIFRDDDVMQALIAANDAAWGENVIDMRGIAMQRLQDRLCHLEDVHQSVIAAAYDNLAGTQLIHAAVLSLVEVRDIGGLAALLDGPLATTLRVDRTVLVIEAECRHATPAMRPAEPGWIEHYLGCGAAVPRRVTLRQAGPILYQDQFDGSEACLLLDLGAERRPGLFCMAVDDPTHFHAGQGTELLEFLARALEHALDRLLP